MATTVNSPADRMVAAAAAHLDHPIDKAHKDFADPVHKDFAALAHKDNYSQNIPPFTLNSMQT